MEQMRLLLAIVLSFLVFVVWQWLVVEPEMAQQVQEPTTLAESASQPEDASDKAKPIEETPSVLPEDKMRGRGCGTDQGGTESANNSSENPPLYRHSQRKRGCP